MERIEKANPAKIGQIQDFNHTQHSIKVIRKALRQALLVQGKLTWVNPRKLIQLDNPGGLQ